jgi:fructan beta-fructosidase
MLTVILSRGLKMKGHPVARAVDNGNKSTGTLLSPEFKIQRPTIYFLVGGGGAARTSIGLLVDGEVKHRTSGKNNEALQWESWDVSDLLGKAARVRILDEHQEEWGFILVDHIYQSN